MLATYLDTSVLRMATRPLDRAITYEVARYLFGPGAEFQRRLRDDMAVAQLRPEPGESVLLLPLTRPYDDAACRAAIAETTSCKPPSGRCCVVDKSGTVVAVCNADPALDLHPQGQLVANENAVPGDRFISGAFSRPFEIS